MEYVGHKIDATGLHTTESKLRAITEAPAPRNVSKLRSFLGLINYYGKFMANLSSILHLLHKLPRQETPWRWSSECQKTFQLAKDKLASSDVLMHYDPFLPLRLAGDASAYGIGAVILHVLPNGTERLITFASCTLSESEKNYAQIEEALSLVFGVKRFHTYLYGRPFILVTNHKPLTAILGLKKGIPPLAAAQLQHWSMLLVAYNY